MEIQGLPLCPGCGAALQVVELRCPRCATGVHGEFRPSLSGLAPAQQLFAERFLTARGNLKELERELSISYQALRSQLDEIVAVLTPPPRGGREAVLARLRRGELRADEALRLIEAQGPSKNPEDR